MVDYSIYKENSVQGRYVCLKTLQKKWLEKLDASIIHREGISVLGRKIISIKIGFGQNRILMWSQMHGNESTTTKAVLDLINFLQTDEYFAKLILENCSLVIIPILNPDGAELYTRTNANKVDLNRDAKLRSQPESKILRKVFNEFKPHYCFNLHDQRTLFSAGHKEKTATISFLSPASNPEREINPTREKAMKLIAAMAELLQKHIPNQIGRYDDTFNENCVGDTFQMHRVPTILFEAGHYPKDYEREKTRELIFKALLEGLSSIGMNTVENFKTDDYYKIPENEKLFFDILIKNPHLVNPNLNEKNKIGIRFKEVLEKGAIVFQPEVVSIEPLEGFFGHETFDCSLKEDYQALSKHPEILKLIVSSKQ